MAAKKQNKKTTTKKTRAKRAPLTKKLALSEQVRISHSSELKDQLTKLLSAKKKIEIDASKVEKIDTSGLQLLTAFSIQANAQAIELEWRSPSEPFIAAAKLLDLTQYLGLAEKKTLCQPPYVTM